VAIAGASVVVGVLTGVADGGIANKVKMARLARQQASAQRQQATAASRAIIAAEEAQAAERAAYLARNPATKAKPDYSSLDDFLLKEGSMPGEAGYARESLKRATIGKVKSESVELAPVGRTSADEGFDNFLALQRFKAQLPK